MVSRKRVVEVFTPRSAEVNESMYVRRSGLEAALLRAVQGSQHVLLCGESGNGKSWLYRKVLYGEVPYVAANCANAARCGSITKEIERVAFAEGSVSKVAYTESKSAGLKAVVAEAGVTHEGEYQIRQQEPLLAAFWNLSRTSLGNPTVVVLENLESIFASADLMDEMARIILLLDDPAYSNFRIKLLIVGTPSGVIEYFSKTKNLESVANRILEIPKVGGFTEPQVGELIRRGFVSGLGVKLTEDEILFLTDHIFGVTIGVAQRVHEYCEQLGFRIEDNSWVYHRDLLRAADSAWLSGGLRISYSVVENKLNSRDTSVARRNQVIYAIGKTKSHQFDSAIIEAIIRREFPSTVSGKNLGISTILAELAAGEEPLVSRVEKTGQYRIRDPRYMMCIRTALVKDPHSGKVRKKNFISG